VCFVDHLASFGIDAVCFLEGVHYLVVGEQEHFDIGVRGFRLNYYFQFGRQLGDANQEVLIWFDVVSILQQVGSQTLKCIKIKFVAFE